MTNKNLYSSAYKGPFHLSSLVSLLCVVLMFTLKGLGWYPVFFVGLPLAFYQVGLVMAGVRHVHLMATDRAQMARLYAAGSPELEAAVQSLVNSRKALAYMPFQFSIMVTIVALLLETVLPKTLWIVVVLISTPLPYLVLGRILAVEPRSVLTMAANTIPPNNDN